MQDLHVIQKQNAQAIERNIPDLRARGHYIVVERAGLHVIGCENFSGDGAQDRAEAKLAEINAVGGTVHGQLLAPTARETMHEHKAAHRAAALGYPTNDDHLTERLGVAA